MNQDEFMRAMTAAKTDEERRQLMRQYGGTVSDGALEHGFDEAWGMHPLKGRVAHHWTKVATKQPHAVLYESKCGRLLPVNKMFPMLGPGNYPLCENCTRRMIKMGWRPAT
jgi:hypothetical protein